MRRTSRTLALLALSASVLIGCGGSDDDSAGDAPADSTTDEETSNGDATNGDATNGDATNGEASGNEPSVGEDMAVVTVGDTTYEFTLNYCQTFLDGLAGGGSAADGSDVNLTFSLPPRQGGEALDIASITVDDEELGERWEADETVGEMITSIEAGQSEVTSFEVDGKQASGTGSFVETYGAMSGPTDAVEGTFEMSCS